MKQTILSDAQIFNAVNYIHQNDRHSDILDYFQEYLDGTVNYCDLQECLEMTFTEWSEDMLLNGLDDREKSILDSLNVRYNIDYKEAYENMVESNAKLIANYSHLEQKNALLIAENIRLKEYVEAMDEQNTILTDDTICRDETIDELMQKNEELEAIVEDLNLIIDNIKDTLKTLL